MDTQGQGESVVQDAINAVTDTQVVLLRFDVDVRGPVLYCLSNEEVYSTHNRSLGDKIGAYPIACFHPLRRSGEDVAELLFDLARGAVVEVDGPPHVHESGAQGLDLHPGESPDVLKGV